MGIQGIQVAEPPPESGYPAAEAAIRKPVLENPARGATDPCEDCLLCGGRRFPGKGPHGAALMMIGDYPSSEDEAAGVIFSGEVGILLDKIFCKMGYSRSAVYLSTAIQCRPCAGKPPPEKSAKACASALGREIAIASPRAICTLGSFATHALLGLPDPIARLRGKRYDWNGIAVFPTFHPAHLLKNPKAKNDVWQDMQAIMAFLKEKPKGQP